MRSAKDLLLGGFMLVLLALGVWGCRSQNATGDLEPQPAPSRAPEHYVLHGTVLGISTQTGELTVQHDEIHGFMPAMTMAYKIADPAVLPHLRAGDEIAAVMLVPVTTEGYRLDAIKVLRHGGSAELAALPPHTLLPGEAIPDVLLENQDGKPLHLRTSSDRALLLTFIYTRCPMPTACPMIASHFARVNTLLAANPQLAARSHLLSITLDPVYDTPPVLRAYGLAYLGDRPEGFAHWEFARTEPSQLKSLAAAFGLEYHEENNQIVHTVRTILIDRSGHVSRTWDGSSWKPQEVADAVAAVALGKAR